MNGNTAELVKPFFQELQAKGAEVTYITLSNKTILPCKGCYSCQHVDGEYGCVQADDVSGIMEEIIRADCLVLATPIYSWYCTAPMKALLDRHYGLNKFYGRAEGSLWAGKKVALITTHGYESDYATSPFVTGIQRLCEHSALQYLGMYSVRHRSGKADFRTPLAIKGAKDFANQLL